MPNQALKIPKTAKHASKSKKYQKVTPPLNEKKKWVMLRQKGQWHFARAATATASGHHIVCYYDPNTGFYDDCHMV
jgi:hypothetical protein